MTLFKTLLISLLASLSLAATAQEATIRKNLAERLPNLPAIEEINKTPIPGVWEIRINAAEILYTDSEGNYLIQGSLFDTRNRVDLTEQRIQKLSAVDFKSLPLKDAVKLVRGKGTRQLAVFEDPNCSFCKRFERDMLKIDDVTVHVFLYPILGPDSVKKSNDIWCAKDRAKAYLDWMVRNTTPPEASCDTAAVERNVEFGRKLRVTGTPTLLFVDGTRVPGAIGTERIEAMLKEAQPR